MIFLGKNACNRIIFITFAVKCISSTRRFKSISTRLQSPTRRLTIQCNMDTAKLHKLCVATRNVRDWCNNLRQREKKPVLGSRRNMHI